MTAEPDDIHTARWVPTPQFIGSSNMGWLMRQVGAATYQDLHAWSVENRAAYWERAIERLGILFQSPYERIVDLSAGVSAPRWLVGSKLNIVDSCFTAPGNDVAVIYQAEGGPIRTMSVNELAALTDQVAANLSRRGYRPGTALAIVMPMTPEAVAIYLGIIKAGCVAVGIADSFQPKEVASRLRLSQAAAVFTQDVSVRGGKVIPLYAKVIEASAPPAIVVETDQQNQATLRAGDLGWTEFLASAAAEPSRPCNPSDPMTILFSSGTTGEPKLIPWTQTTPIKCAADAHFHHNIQPGDVLAWPTNMGWMMGPWLVFASLMNRAAMALYDGAPTGRAFGKFVEQSRATLLGVVPSLVKTWRHSHCMEQLDWSAIKLFSSTGECSNPDDMAWLMQRAGGKPVVEYCGGTEIGGAYITSTLTLPCVAGTFNTPALGLDVAILDDHGQAASVGECFIVPPSIGLSTTLLNSDHHAVYFDGVPTTPRGEVLRRHGDQMERLADGCWRALGRADDTMNLGGIKVSSAEIERVLQTVPGVLETAAIAVSPTSGPSLLVIYVVKSASDASGVEQMKAAMQSAIKRDLNPLFKIHDLVEVDALPRTASNKVMRRTLRDRYLRKP